MDHAQVQWRIQGLLTRLRRWRYRQLSTNQDAFGRAIVIQPTLIVGPGRFELGRVQLGYWPSPGFFGGYIHLEARSPESRVSLADGVVFNNNCVMISDGAGISIGERTLLGPDVQIYDTDFHPIDPELRSQRGGGNGGSSSVVIGSNVFIGAGAKVLKGSTIGDGSVVGAGSVVSGSIPSNVVAAGAPCRIVRSLASPPEHPPDRRQPG